MRVLSLGFLFLLPTPQALRRHSRGGGEGGKVGSQDASSQDATKIRVGRDGTNSCPSGTRSLSQKGCISAAAALGFPFQSASARNDRPGGCWKGGSGKVNFNSQSGRGSSGRAPICGSTVAPSPSPGPTTINVRVIVLRDENGRADSSAPWTDSRSGTLPLNGNGNLTNPGGSLATDLSAGDISEIFSAVNEIYADTGIQWNVVGPFFTKPTVPCGKTNLVCDKKKCRSPGYFVRYWGSINKQISFDGREERATNIFSNIPRELFKEGEFHFVYQKYLGWSSQGVVFGTRDSSGLRPRGGGDVSVATCAQWSNKFTSEPTKRPNTARCGDSGNCGIGLHYTTAHELGHLLGVGHSDAPSLMSGGGGSASDSKFSKGHISTMQSYRSAPRLIPSYAGKLSGTARGGSDWKENTQCR